MGIRRGRSAPGDGVIGYEFARPDRGFLREEIPAGNGYEERPWALGFGCWISTCKTADCTLCSVNIRSEKKLWSESGVRDHRGLTHTLTAWFLRSGEHSASPRLRVYEYEYNRTVIGNQ